MGKGAFSAVYKCHDLLSSAQQSIAIKVANNTKDSFDTSCAEVRILSLIRQHGGSAHHLLQMRDYFYWREHLIIVTDLQHESLFNFCHNFGCNEDRLRFFDQKMFATLSSQMLDALSFLHELGITHCDVKSDNVCLSATRPGHFTLIDLGSAVLSYDVWGKAQNSHAPLARSPAPHLLPQPQLRRQPALLLHTLSPRAGAQFVHSEPLVPRPRGDTRYAMGRQGGPLVARLHARRSAHW